MFLFHILFNLWPELGRGRHTFTEGIRIIRIKIVKKKIENVCNRFDLCYMFGHF